MKVQIIIQFDTDDLHVADKYQWKYRLPYMATDEYHTERDMLNLIEDVYYNKKLKTKIKIKEE